MNQSLKLSRFMVGTVLVLVGVLLSLEPVAARHDSRAYWDGRYYYGCNTGYFGSDSFYAHYNALDTGSWNRLEDIKGALGNPTFEGNDGTHYYIYTALPRALKITSHVIANTDGYEGSNIVPNGAVITSGARVTIRLNTGCTDVTHDTKDWNNFDDVRSVLGDPNYDGYDGGRYYIYDSLRWSIRASDRVHINANGREGSNYVPNGDVVNKGQRATIRLTNDQGGSSYYPQPSGETINASSLENDDRIRDLARDGHVTNIGDRGRVFVTRKNIYIDTDEYQFDWERGRANRGDTILSNRQVTFWRK
jgi:hypothetical protein